jgi:hypothetical protein
MRRQGLTFRLGAGLAVLLAGCDSAPLHRVGPAAQVLPRLPDRCGVAGVQGLIGQPFVALAGYRLPGALRVLYPDQVVTAEVQPSRLNATVDRETRITALFCG